MKSPFVLVVRLLVLALPLVSPDAAAKSLPLDPPDPARGVIGVRVKVIPPLKIGFEYAHAVYFERIPQESGGSSSATLVPSNYSKGKNVYLLNAEPGHYVVVGCEYERPPLKPGGLTSYYTVVYSKEDIPRTEVDVLPGRTVFMGGLKTTTSSKIKNADSTQSSNLRMIAPRLAIEGFVISAMGTVGEFWALGTIKNVARSAVDEVDFWSDARAKHFEHDEAWKRYFVEHQGKAAAPAAQ